MFPHINDYLPIVLGIVVFLVLINGFDALLLICNIGINRVPRKNNVEDQEKIENGIKLIEGAGLCCVVLCCAVLCCACCAVNGVLFYCPIPALPLPAPTSHPTTLPSSLCTPASSPKE